MNVSTGDNDLLCKISKDILEATYSGKSLQLFKLNKREIPLLHELLMETQKSSPIFHTMFASEILNLMIRRGSEIKVIYCQPLDYWYELDNLDDYRILIDFIESNGMGN
jgi:hypothetical protein